MVTTSPSVTLCSAAPKEEPYTSGSCQKLDLISHSSVGFKSETQGPACWFLCQPLCLACRWQEHPISLHSLPSLIPSPVRAPVILHEAPFMTLLLFLSRTWACVIIESDVNKPRRELVSPERCVNCCQEAGVFLYPANPGNS